MIDTNLEFTIEVIDNGIICTEGISPKRFYPDFDSLMVAKLEESRASYSQLRHHAIPPNGWKFRVYFSITPDED